MLSCFNLLSYLCFFKGIQVTQQNKSAMKLHIENKNLDVICEDEFTFSEKVRKINLTYRKRASGILVFITIDSNVMGEFFIEEKSFFKNYRDAITGLSSGPASSIQGTSELSQWEKNLEYFPEFKEVEDSLSFFTLLFLVELRFPTNWLLLLPEKKK